MSSFKHSLRDAWLSSSYYLGISQLYKNIAGRKRGIISYHNVLPLQALPLFDTYNVDVTETIFEQQIIFLKKHFKILPISDLEASPAEGFFLTVDDGMANNYSHLAPILDKHNLTALFAVCPAMIDQQKPYIWRDHLFLLLQRAYQQQVLLPINNYEEPILVENINLLTRALKKYVHDQQLADIYGMIQDICAHNGWEYRRIAEADTLRYNFMTWNEIQSLQTHGHAIASHTNTHRILKYLPDNELYTELFESKKILDSKLNCPVTTLVYPYGGMNEIDNRVAAAAQEAGYKRALMNVQNHNLTPTQFTIPRFAFPPIASTPHLYGIVSGYKFLNKKLLKF
jgi:peptidoglycan/xylan/chitin deacetylase (PgdA/CDA1 family)